MKTLDDALNDAMAHLHNTMMSGNLASSIAAAQSLILGAAVITAREALANIRLIDRSPIESFEKQTGEDS